MGRFSRTHVSPWGTFFQSSVANSDAKRHDFALEVSKSVPQRLKPDSLHSSYVRPEGRTLQTKRVLPQPVKPAVPLSYGTAEAVPFVQQSLPQAPRVSEGFICFPTHQQLFG